jgi:RecA-family ATPase
VQGLLGAGEMSAVYGAPGSGKSVVVEDLCLHIAVDWEWHGRKVKHGAVLYVALERANLVKRRAIAFRKKHGVKGLPFAIVADALDFRDVKNEDGRPTSRAAERIAFLCRQVERETGCKVVLIVLDTLSRGLAGGDENSPKDMGGIVTASAKMQADTGAHVMWVHHVPHEAERMRGHGALLGAVDTAIHVTKLESCRKATVTKANDSEEGEAVIFDLESVTIGDDGTTAPVVVTVNAPAQEASGPKLTKNQQTLFGMLHDAGNAGLTLEEWNRQAKDAGIGVKRKADLNDIRSALRSKDLVRQMGDRWFVNQG